MIFIENLGKLILFIALFFKFFLKPKFYLKINFKYFINVFISSIPIIALTGIFSGMVLALQSYTGFSRFSAESAIDDPTLADIIKPVNTGPSSLVKVKTTILGIADSAENLENPV